jgi:hypothetical protein
MMKIPGEKEAAGRLEGSAVKKNQPADIAEVCEASGFGPEHYVEFQNRPAAEGPPVFRQLLDAATAMEQEPVATPAMRQPLPLSEPWNLDPPPHETVDAFVGLRRPGLSNVVESGATGSDMVHPEWRAVGRLLLVAPVLSGMGCTTFAANLGCLLHRTGTRTAVVGELHESLLRAHFKAQADVGRHLDNEMPLVLEGPANPAGRDSWLSSTLSKCRDEFGWTIVDIVALRPDLLQAPFSLEAVCIMPVLPDLRSARAVIARLDTLEKSEQAGYSRRVVYFVLNQLDPHRPFQLEVHSYLAERLGDRLAPVAIPYSADVEDALSEGITVVNYKPQSEVAASFRELAAWVSALKQVPPQPPEKKPIHAMLRTTSRR